MLLCLAGLPHVCPALLLLCRRPWTMSAHGPA